MKRMPLPFVSLAPAAIAPVVLTCEHATCRLPPHIRPSREEREVLRAHWGWDIGAWALTRRLARDLQCGAVGGRWSRLWVDLNRRIDNPTLSRREVVGIPLSWNRRLGPPQLERRVLAFHAPYHAEVDRLILRRVVRGIRPLIFSAHSYTPVLARRRRRFDIGILYERDLAAARLLARRLRGAGLSVRYNEPYSGMAGMMYSVDRHAKHHGLPCLELEVNQRLFDAPRSVDRLGALVAPAVAELVAGDAGSW